jgi:hypothetical protein
MPLSVAIAKSMKRNFKEICGLDICFTDALNGKGHKNRVIRFDDPDDTDLAEYGDPKGEHIKMVYGGTMVQGSPVGVDVYRAEQLRKVVVAKMGGACDALARAPNLQVRSFLGQQCAGPMTVQHVMRSQAARIWEMKPEDGGKSAIELVEAHSKGEWSSMVGGSYLSPRAMFQMSLATRMGGSGLGPVRQVLGAAMLGGWVAAHSSSTSLADLDPRWENESWTGAAWQTCVDVQRAWKRVIEGSKHLGYLAAAIQARGVVAFGMSDGDEDGDDRGGSFGRYHAACDKAWKVDKVGASEVAEIGATAWERMDLDLQAVVSNYGDVQAVAAPADHLGVLKKWMGLGDRQFQKISQQRPRGSDLWNI